MTLPAAFFALSLASANAGDAAEPWRMHEAECQSLTDAAPLAQAGPAQGYAAAADACRKAFEAAVKLADRSVFVFEAHRLYRRAHATGHKTALCTSAPMLRTFAAQLDEPGAEDRPNDRKDISARLMEIEPQLATLCPTSDGAAGGRSVVRSSIPKTTEVDPKPQPIDRGPESPPARRPLRVAGGVVLGLGLGLGAAMVGALVRGASLHAQADAVNNAHRAQTIPEAQASDFAAITARGERADHLAIGLGVVAAALSVTGATLIVVDARRRKAARFAVHPSILPTAGLRFAMEF